MSGNKHAIHNTISELQRKIQLLERDRSAYFESSQSVIEKNRETILQLRHENENLLKKLAEGEEQVIKDVFQDRGMENASFRNMSVKSAQTVLEKEVCDKAKKLNAMKHTTDTQRQRLEELKLQYESKKPQSRSPLTDNQKLDEEKKLRILENQVEKVQLKHNEAENVMREYLKVKDQLQEESLTFHPQLDWMEAEIRRQTQVLNELKVTNSDAHFSKDAAVTELQLQEEQVHRERRERDEILSCYKKQEKIAQAERMKRRASIIHHTSANNLPDELSSEAQSSASAGEEVEAISPYEEAFEQLKEVTGVTDPQEILGRFISQRKTQEHLEKMKAENERILLQLKEEKNALQTQLEDMKHSGETELLSRQQVCEQQLKQTQQRRDAAKDRLDRLKHTLNTVKAGVKHLSDKLQHIPLMKGPTPQLSPDSEEQTLQLMSEFEQKLMLLKEELQGVDQATILKEIEEEEFLAKIAANLPQDNTRIQFHKDQKLDSFDDEGSDTTAVSRLRRTNTAADV